MTHSKKPVAQPALKAPAKKSGETSGNAPRLRTGLKAGYQPNIAGIEEN